MILKTNTEVFERSVAHLEPMGDKFYRNEKIIISEDPAIPNDLIKRNREILEQITAYKVAQEHKDQELMVTAIIDKIDDLLSVPEINVSEFVTFWATLDFSYSGFHALPTNKRREFLKEAINAYIQSRYTLYSNHGYTATTLQVRQDSFAHKGSGNNALNKLTTLFTSHNFSRANSKEEFISKEKVYIFPDAIDSQVSDELIVELGLSFKWSKLHQGKRPDAAFKLNNEIFLLEHKHKKEGGGGQNSQLGEIISFIDSKEKQNIHFVSFLDGVYFNELVSGASKKSKVYRQLKQIKSTLKKCPLNYFVNTSGFEFLIS